MKVKPKRITKNEKTDFIVNMTKPQFMKMEFIYLVIACLGAFLSCVAYLLKRGTSYLSGDMSASTLANAMSMKAFGMLRYGAVIIMAVGFLGYLMLFISNVKGYYKLKENKIFMLVFGYILLCGISTLLANDISLAFFGVDGRYEGFIAVVAYVGFFFGASQLTDKRLKEKLLMVIGVGISLNTLVGIFQSFEATSEIFPSFFVENYSIYGNQTQHFLASGFTSSPYALSSLGVMGLAVCLGGFMYADSKTARIVFAICGSITTLGGFLTKNIAVCVGFCVVAITLGVIEILRLAKKHCLWVKGFTKNSLGRFFVGIIVAGIIFIALCITNNFSLYDEYILKQDAIRVLCPLSSDFLNSGLHIYTDVWKNILKIIKENFVFGVGFEGLVGSDLSKLGNPDRAYNEFLNIAVNTGVVSLVFYVGFLVGCAIKCAKGVGKFFNKEDNFTKAVAFSGCAGYIATSMFCNTDFVATPIFFVLLGLAVSKSEQTK